MHVSNYTIEISNAYKDLTAGRFPRLEECFGLNYRCFLELNSRFYGSDPYVNTYESIAIDYGDQLAILAVSDNTKLEPSIDTNDCGVYFDWLTKLLDKVYDENVDYCAIKGDMPSIWAYLGIDRNQFMQAVNGQTTLDKRTDEEDCLEEKCNYGWQCTSIYDQYIEC